MEEKKCAICGKTFVPDNGMQKFCRNPHFLKCVVCGKLFEVPQSRLGEKDLRKTCSRKCTSELRKQTNFSVYGGPAPASSSDVRKKMKSTSLMRYGTEVPQRCFSVKQKAKETSLQRYGCESPLQNEEVRKKIADTNKAKYGSASPMKNSAVKSKAVKTSRERYGVDHPMQNEDFKSRFFKKYEESTGYSSPFSNPSVREKSRSRLQAHYGVDHPLQSKEIRDVAESTNLERYGCKNAMQSEEIKQKVKKTCKIRYGSDCYLSSEAGRTKFKQSLLSNYDVEVFSKSASWKLQRMKDPSKIDRLMMFDSDPSSFIDAEFDHRPSLIEVANYCGVGTEAISTRLTKHDCKDKVEYVRSTMERDVSNFIQSLSETIIIEHDNREVIKPYEIDIYLPEYKIGFECNPASTHNSTINSWEPDKEPVRPSYHKMKTDMAEKAGIFLFHIFGYDWDFHQDVIQSMIANLLGFSQIRLDARKAIVKNVSASEASKFLGENHRQGKVGSKIRLGLYIEDELVSLMTFSKLRFTIGKSETNDNSWELVRFCNKKYTVVRGAAGKLFSYFVKCYHPDIVKSYSDRAHTKGNMYLLLGFKEISRSDPNYLWVDIYSDRPYHRINAQKQNIKKFLEDDSLDVENRTEKDIMVQHGFVQVYDSGTILWKWTRNT